MRDGERIRGHLGVGKNGIKKRRSQRRDGGNFSAGHVISLLVFTGGILPPAISEFLADSIDVPVNLIPDFWEITKDEAWLPPNKDEPNKEDEECFRRFGWKRELTCVTLYPPEETCTNPDCLRDKAKALKKAEFREIVLYTVGMGACRSYSAHLSCPDCDTHYHYNFSHRNGIRTYYEGMPKYLQVGEHQFVENKLIEFWISSMLLGWMSAKNCAVTYDRALSMRDQKDAEEGGWRFGMKLTTEHVWDAFVLWSLLGQHYRKNLLVSVPHTGEQKHRFTKLMQEQNDEIINEGQDQIDHYCDKCMHVWEDGDGNLYKCQVIISDGTHLSHPCCGVFRCPNPLQNNRHRFCQEHFDQHDVCAITECTRPIQAGTKTCDTPAHQKMEKLHVEKGKAAFTLTERSRRQCLSHPDSATAADVQEDKVEEEKEDLEEDDTWFETDSSSGNVKIFTVPDPGTAAGGVEELENADGSSCPATKSALGNKKFKAQFARRRTHNKQTLVRPCGVIVARATFFGAEAVSNVLIFIKRAFSVPRAQKPDHIVYDSNCLAKQQVIKNPWFDGIGMCVEVWHFMHKHQQSDNFCQEHCNPADYPELMDADGKAWAFNTSVAEQSNGWINGYTAICREMSAIKYDFFLDEMIRLQNEVTIARLAAQGQNPRNSPARSTDA
ncbi:hypothetical protein GALMADRAFT_76807 [Galerina marginata CBS 339.88]|uniref:CxC6 like cysteine cluster associated with KDZ domain-containing protein n=1 Tax=Galerina marginata (strain CBS 339.88) TaxID=685588 RepID=A0A067SG54_GALM3|nr:hypothetical protein GALMADRAFT_76807 [Galerina marginata CBS 339.88]